MIWIVVIFVCCFGFVLWFGAPYFPTLSRQQNDALDLLNLKPGQILLELGSGDGRMLKAAAKRGIKVVGYELNPILFIISVIVTLRYRKLVTVRLASFWASNWPECDAIYVFLLDKFMSKLDKKIIQSNSKKIKVVSYAFKIPNREIIRQSGALYLYHY